MAIRVLSEDERSNGTYIVTVEVTDDEGPRLYFEVHCSDCGDRPSNANIEATAIDILTSLPEAEAAADEHECPWRGV